LGLIEAIGSGAQQPQPSPVPAQGRAQLPGQLEQVLADHTDRVEAIRHDGGPGEPPFDDRAVRVGQVDAHDPHLFAAPQGAQVGGQIGLAAAGGDVKDPPAMQIAKGGREALAAVQGVLIDAEHPGAIHAQALLRLPLGKLSINASDGGLTQALPLGQHRGADPVVRGAHKLIPATAPCCAGPAAPQAGAAQSCARNRHSGNAGRRSPTHSTGQSTPSGGPVAHTSPCCGGGRLRSKGTVEARPTPQRIPASLDCSPSG